MNIDDIKLILSIIGAVTGSLALIIDFFNYKFYLPKLIIKPLNNSYFLNKKDVKEASYYETTRIAVVSLKISNSSAHPITVDNVYIKSNKREIFHFKDFKFTVPKLLTNKNPITYSRIEYLKIAVLPLRIEPFDSQYVSFIFPYFDNCNTRFKIFLETPRKNHSVKVNLSEYHDLVLSQHHTPLKK